MGPDPRPLHLAHTLTLTPITNKKVKLQENPELTGCEHEKFGLKDLKWLLHRLSRDAASEAHYMHKFGLKLKRAAPLGRAASRALLFLPHPPHP